ncbi:hypothetical protein ACVWZZ_003143 [Bradyrhizobium sp. LM6.10]|jgi:hypothetical protein
MDAALARTNKNGAHKQKRRLPKEAAFSYSNI